MKTLPTQFDNSRLSNAVATPTCSSCCCCCCCLVTSVTSTTVVAQQIAKAGKLHHVKNRQIYTSIAALFALIVGGLLYASYTALNQVVRTCTDVSTAKINCTNLSAKWLLPLVFILSLIVLSFLYYKVKINKPLIHAFKMSVIIALSLALELLIGVRIILAIGGYGGLATYMFLSVIITSWITIWYYRRTKNFPSL
jgi:hypothetical protein